jgi:hypothetical protein
MYKEILRNISGVGVFPAVSLVLFCLVFTAMLVRVFRMSRAETERLARLPFDAAPAARQEADR